MKRQFVISLVGLLFLGIFCTPSLAGRFHRGDIVKVMTRNQYLGANLDSVIQAKSPEEFLAAATDALKTITVNNFPLRARSLAAEVALTKPDLIGLQEVFDFKLNGQNSRPPFVDHLAVTLDALAAKGQSYKVAATLNNLDIELLLDINGDEILELLRVLDRDVILAREGVRVTKLTGLFTDGGLCGVEIPNPATDSVPPFPDMLMSTPSEDGCNYTIVAKVDEEDLPPITIERGFVGVDATVRGKTYRFVNTHLEGADPAIIQHLQAFELVKTLQTTTPDDLPLILVGDFNSSPEDALVDPDVPYQLIVDEGFADIWDTNLLKFFDPNGLTCCQDDDLLNRTSHLDERIDLIFIRDTSLLPIAFVTGRVPIFPLNKPPNWASDHDGVFGRLIFR
jgi:endonuclease/exonuclease/phosphatase family metal-dependent hydrolase